MNFKKVLSCSLGVMLVCGALMGCTDGDKKDTGNTAANNTETTQAQSTQAADTYQRGTRTDKEFTSEWLGLKYTLSEGMIMMTDEQMEQAMQIGSEHMYEDSKTGQKMIDYAKLNSVYEMAATKADSGESVIITVEKMNITLNEDQYVEALKAQLKKTTSTPIYEDVKKREVAGIEFTDVTYSMTKNGVKLKQTMLIKKKDNRIIGIAITYRSEEAFNSLIAGFAAL